MLIFQGVSGFKHPSNVAHKHVHDTDVFSCLNFHVGKTNEKKYGSFFSCSSTFEPFLCFQDWENHLGCVCIPRMPVAENHGIYDMFGLPEVPFLSQKTFKLQLDLCWNALIYLTLIFFRIPKKNTSSVTKNCFFLPSPYWPYCWWFRNPKQPPEIFTWNTVKKQ